MEQPAEIAKLFWGRVQKTNDDLCWEWTGHVKKNGYGQIMHKLKTYPAHRLSWLLNRGEIPNQKCVLHTCDNRKCVNPKHLYIGNLSDNMNDMWGRKRHPITPQKGVLNNFAKLNNEQVTEIRHQLLLNPQKGIARKLAHHYNVTESTISYIKKNKTWQGVGV